MPSLNPYTVIHWRVVWRENKPAVVFRYSDLISVFVPDGSTLSPDSQVIGQYLLSIDLADRAAATQEIADGLIAFIPGQGQKSTVTAPPVPPRILAEGPLAADLPPNVQQFLNEQRQQFLEALRDLGSRFKEAAPRAPASSDREPKK